MKKMITINDALIEYDARERPKGIKILSIAYNSPDSTYKIPAKIEELPVIKLGTAFAKTIVAKEVIVPDTGYTLVLEPGCFSEMNHVESIVISASIKTIPSNCFYFSNVKKIKFQKLEEIQKVESRAFASTKNLTTFKWPSSCKIIPNECFCCSELRKISGTENVERIEAAAFSRCELKMFRWPDKCTCIPVSCFSHSPIKTVENINHVTQIRLCAFQECTSLKSFAWPSGCDEIPKRCFEESGLIEISGIEHVKSIGCSAFEKTELDKFYWPKECKIVPVDCFKFSRLKEIYFSPSSVETIDEGAFEGTAFKEFVIPEVNSVAANAFNNMLQLKTIILPKDQNDLPVNSFWQCGRLERIVYSADAVNVDDSRLSSYFSNRKDLERVLIDMSQVSELVFEKHSVKIERFLKRVQLGFDTNISIID